MSKKKRNAVSRLSIGDEKPTARASNSPVSSTSTDNASSQSWWKRLGKFERLAIIGISLLLVSVIFGATGLVKRINDTVSGDLTDQDQIGRNNSQFLSLNPVTTGTPQLSKEYIYAGSRMLAVEDVGVNVAPPADLAVWRPGTGYWYVMSMSGTIQAAQQWGNSTDKAVPGDYDGDGKTDFCVFRPAENIWYVLKSSNNSYYGITFGTSGDKTAPADYDGDGKTDIAVYRPSNGTWYVAKSSDSNLLVQQFGLNDDKPAAADYDGDGRADFGVWRGSDKTFYSLKSSNGQLHVATLSQAATTVVPVSCDFDGDGKADFAVHQDTSWIIKYSSNNQTEIISPSWELIGDTEVQNDYDGDGKVDIAVWRNSSGDWYIRQSAHNNQLRQEHWGQSGDIPVPAFYRR
jgi:hypothetical protein